MVHFKTEKLEDFLTKLDGLYNSNSITTGEYIQIGLLLKIFEKLLEKNWR